MNTSPDRHFVVLSAMGTDRPGIVAEVTGHLHEIGCNVEDSRMATLGGEFGLMMLVSGTAGQIADLGKSRPQLQRHTGLQIALKETLNPETMHEQRAIPYAITAYALDREGIVHAVTQSLATLGVNIRSLETEKYHAPTTGAPLFEMTLLVLAPAGVSPAQLRGILDEVALRENIDIEMRPA